MKCAALLITFISIFQTSTNVSATHVSMVVRVQMVLMVIRVLVLLEHPGHSAKQVSVALQAQ